MNKKKMIYLHILKYLHWILILISSSEKKSSVQKRKRIIDNTQYQIYAGQKKFGGFLCKECGLYYSRGEPEDEAEHDKYHKAKEIFKYKVCWFN